MTQETFYGWWAHQKRLSKYELRKQQEKALQSYQQIATLQEKANKEHEQASKNAETELDQFITSNKTPHGK